MSRCRAGGAYAAREHSRLGRIRRGCGIKRALEIVAHLGPPQAPELFQLRDRVAFAPVDAQVDQRPRFLLGDQEPGRADRARAAVVNGGVQRRHQPVAQLAELTGLLPGLTAAGWPEGMRVLVRRERPHPGAQISLFEAVDGWRYQCVATDTDHGQLPFLEARHRAHAHVEDRVKAIKQTGMGRFPSREFAINQVWLQLALTAADLIAWTQTILLAGVLGQVEVKKLRYRLLHTAARIVRGQRKVRIRIDSTWPWAGELAAAFTRLDEIRQPLII